MGSPISTSIRLRDQLKDVDFKNNPLWLNPLGVFWFYSVRKTLVFIIIFVKRRTIMKEVLEFIDIKITALFGSTMLLFEGIDIQGAYKVIAGMVFLGYNIHRWIIMYRESEERRNQNQK